MLAYYADDPAAPAPELPAGHRFPIAKYGLLRQAVLASLPGIKLARAEPASDGELALAHSPDWIAAVAQGRLSAAQEREIGFPWSPRMAERARRSVGATVAAARQALLGGQGVAGNLAGGTHHANAQQGSGFCIFNDVAVAARLMQAEWRRQRSSSLRVLVIDLDVHQGNGTASIFTGDASVFTLSLHGARNFPFRKVASSLDVDLPDGCEDAAYLAALDGALSAVEAHHQDVPPGLVFYLAGADPHEGDRLGRLKLTAAGLAARDERVFSWLRQRHLPVALSMAGGYGRDLAVTVDLQRQTLALAFQSWQIWAAESGAGPAHLDALNATAPSTPSKPMPIPTPPPKPTQPQP